MKAQSLFKPGIASLCFSSLCTVVLASPISGSISINTGTVNLFNQSFTPVSTLGLNDIITFGNIPFLGANSYVNGSTGDFTAVPTYTGINQSAMNLTNLLAFNWNSSFGSFAASNVVIGGNPYTPHDSIHINSLGQTVLDVYEYGVFTPSGPLGGYGPNVMVETMSFTQTGVGTAVSCSATAVTTTPEPTPLLAMTCGIVGIYGLRKRNSRSR